MQTVNGIERLLLTTTAFALLFVKEYGKWCFDHNYHYTGLFSHVKVENLQFLAEYHRFINEPYDTMLCRETTEIYTHPKTNKERNITLSY